MPFKKRFAVLPLVVGLLLAPTLPAVALEGCGEVPVYFYHPRNYGSDYRYNPLNALVAYSLDTLQIPESFGTDDLSGQFNKVLDHLGGPGGAIEEEGGLRDFVNRQVFPIDLSNSAESVEMIPNYGLHLFGGGMLFRRDLEWFRCHGVPWPALWAGLLTMTGELAQEVIEKKTTTPDDEVADFYIFRPLGMLLFSFDPVARWAAEDMGMRAWPHQPMFSLSRGKAANVGMNFVLRPRWFGADSPRPFLYFGLNNMVGLAHRLSQGDTVSWAVGGATERVSSSSITLRPSAGLFYDRHGSLLSSLIFNGTEDLAVRLNVFPGVVGSGPWSPGVFFAVENGGGLQGGISLRWMPLGLSGE